MNLEDLIKKYSIRLLIQFGSTVSGRTHNESDVDIAYLSVRNLDLREEGQLIIDIADVFKFPVDKIELLKIKHASPLLLKEIFLNNIALYAENNTIFSQYKIYSIRLFEESKRIFENTARVVSQRANAF